MVAVAVCCDEWEWYGNAGHFISRHKCRFHLTTIVGKFLVSTVGELRPDPYRKCEELSPGYFYETMVFDSWERCGGGAAECGNCGCPSGRCCEIECARYKTAGEATRGHMAMCEKWAGKGKAKR